LFIYLLLKVYNLVAAVCVW